jgi:hypothetical protein
VSQTIVNSPSQMTRQNVTSFFARISQLSHSGIVSFPILPEAPRQGIAFLFDGSRRMMIMSGALSVVPATTEQGERLNVEEDEGRA